MEVETICRYKLPVCVVIFNNDGIYRGTDVNNASSDPAPTVFVKGSRYDKMIEAFGGVGVNATIARRVEARRERGDGLRQADAYQRGARSSARAARAAASAISIRKARFEEIKEHAETVHPWPRQIAEIAKSRKDTHGEDAKKAAGRQ